MKQSRIGFHVGLIMLLLCHASVALGTYKMFKTRSLIKYYINYMSLGMSAREVVVYKFSRNHWGDRNLILRSYFRLVLGIDSVMRNP